MSDDGNIESLSNIDGIGSTQIKSIKKFFLNEINLKVLSKLMESLDIESAILINNKGLLKDKTFYAYRKA